MVGILCCYHKKSEKRKKDRRSAVEKEKKGVRNKNQTFSYMNTRFKGTKAIFNAVHKWGS